MPELIKCEHCKATGTCSTANDNSCQACVAWNIRNYNPLENTKEFAGLKCSVCGGLGSEEPTSFKLHNRFYHILAGAFFVAAFALILIFGLMQHPAFDKILVFATTLMGSITGYYFGGERGHVKAKSSPS